MVRQGASTLPAGSLEPAHRTRSDPVKLEQHIEVRRQLLERRVTGVDQRSSRWSADLYSVKDGSSVFMVNHVD
jgi:hypothetical protein